MLKAENWPKGLDPALGQEEKLSVQSYKIENKTASQYKINYTEATSKQEDKVQEIRYSRAGLRRALQGSFNQRR